MFKKIFKNKPEVMYTTEEILVPLRSGGYGYAYCEVRKINQNLWLFSTCYAKLTIKVPS